MRKIILSILVLGASIPVHASITCFASTVKCDGEINNAQISPSIKIVTINTTKGLLFFEKDDFQVGLSLAQSMGKNYRTIYAERINGNSNYSIRTFDIY